MNELALFAATGGGLLGGKLCGFTTRCAVEINPFRASVLLARQRDGLLPHFPIWDNVCTFDGVPWRGIIRVVSGGFPCPDIASGGPGTGIFGTRSGLAFEMLRIIGEVRPAIGLFENSPLLTRRGLEYILFALARMGYDAQWGVLGANQAGASHGRKRAWVLASDPNQKRPSRGNDKRSNQEGWKDTDLSAEILAARPFPTNGNDIPAPHVFGGSDGMANGLERVAACGDGQVPAVVALAWHLLSNE